MVGWVGGWVGGLVGWCWLVGVGWLVLVGWWPAFRFVCNNSDSKIGPLSSGFFVKLAWAKSQIKGTVSREKFLN